MGSQRAGPKLATEQQQKQKEIKMLQVQVTVPRLVAYSVSSTSTRTVQDLPLFPPWNE